MEIQKEKLDILKKYLKPDKRIVVLTGAGISAESGIPTFRGAGEKWRGLHATDLANPITFSKDPCLVWEWYKYRQEIIAKSMPNNGHYVISLIEKTFPKFQLITQNVDGLHQKAGNTKVIELHGNIWKVRCTKEDKMFELEGVVRDIPPKCSCGAILRPHIVWFGENLEEEILNNSFDVSSNCDVFIIAGTSGVVYPAAGLPQTAKSKGAFVVEINLEKTPLSSIANLTFTGKSGEILAEIKKNILFC